MLQKKILSIYGISALAMNNKFLTSLLSLSWIGKIFSQKRWVHQLWIMLPYGWYILMLIAPMIVIFSLSFSELCIGSPPYTSLVKWVSEETVQISLSLGNYFSVLKDPFYRTAFIQSVLLALVSTVLCMAIGYPMAYGISRSKRPTLWLTLAILPFLTSFLVRMYAWISLLTPNGLLTWIFSWLGWEPINLMNTYTAVILGVVYSYLPFMVFPLYASLSKIDHLLLEAAYDLGCRPLSAFWKITVPLSRSGILTGASLVFVPAIGEYIIPELLGGPTCLTIGRLLWSEFFVNRDWPVAAAIAVVLIALILIPTLLFGYLQSSSRDEVLTDVS